LHPQTESALAGIEKHGRSEQSLHGKQQPEDFERVLIEGIAISQCLEDLMRARTGSMNTRLRPLRIHICRRV
jgi:hypothetical protein